MFDITEDDLSSEQSRNLIALHLAGMSEDVPDDAKFLDLSDLLQPEVTVWSAWHNSKIASIGALKMLADGTAEIKSMRTHPDFVGHGAASIILKTIIAAASSRGIHRISLETGSGASFGAAYALYEKHGFKKGEAYSTHKQTEFNHFLHLDLG
ncbi:MAG: GNAT family N-acetyltransferase [Pseudohaliea sp.]